MVNEAVIVDAARTAIGKFRGAFSDVRADHLGAGVLEAIRHRNSLESGSINDVIFGCVTQVGEQSANVARTATLSAGWPDTVPGLTIDRKCGSSEVAVHVAASLIASGTSDIIFAGGVENMSRVPMGSNRSIHGEAFGAKVLDHFEMTSQGEAAERIADKWGFSRGDLDDYAFESHRRAAEASDSGRFDREIVPVAVADWQEPADEASDVTLASDETIRRTTTREKMSTLKTSFRPDGSVTAGNSSQISDGAAALLIMSAEKADTLGLKPRARIRAAITVGSDPTLMLTGPIEATRQALAKAKLTLSDIDLYEINEAFAPVPLMWLNELNGSHDKLNVNGGAIALGHPLGASGARLMTTLLHEMERQDATFGLQSMCCAGGMGTATIIERIA